MDAGAPDGAPFELLRLGAEEVATVLVLVELEGRFPGGVHDDVRLGDATPVRRAVDGDVLRAAFVLPAGATTGLRLRTPDLVVVLPDPHSTTTDRLAGLAREANALRHRVFDADDTIDRLRDELETVTAERDRLLRQVPAEEPADGDDDVTYDALPTAAPRRPTAAPPPRSRPAVSVYLGLAAFGALGLVLVLLLLSP